MMTFIESPAFTRQIAGLMSDLEYAKFQQALTERPDVGDVIPGLGGLRKVRWSAHGQGPRGGARVISLLLVKAESIYLFYAYTKGQMADLNTEQKRRLRSAVDAIKTEFEK